jgi:hypothetical protein
MLCRWRGFRSSGKVCPCGRSGTCGFVLRVEQRMKRSVLSVALLPFVVAAFVNLAVLAQSTSTHSKTFPLSNFDEENHSCRAKGRLQDKEYCESRVMDQIVAQRENAVPILISQLTDLREVKLPIFDYWNRMKVGDIAYFILTGLFTDSDWKTLNMPDLDAFPGTCTKPAEECWHEFVHTRGRKYIQKQWRRAWLLNKNRVYWNAQANCFRLSRKP